MGSSRAKGGAPSIQISLTEHDIRRWVGEASFGRGLSYFNNGHILQPRRQGQSLRARCVGSEDLPYRLWVTLDAQGITAGECNCYVGAGGHCKHVAALLLTWLHEPERFLEQRSIEATLEQHSKAELIALIQRMLARCPELDSLLDVPLLIDGEHLPPVDEDVVAAQVGSAFFGQDDWGPTEVVPAELTELLKLSDAYAEQDRWSDAAILCQAVVDQIASHYQYLDDEDGELEEISSQGVTRLERCLQHSQETALRESILHTLFEVFRRDISYGGLGLSDDAVDTLVQQATDQEKAQVARWVREGMPSPQAAEDDWSANYHRQVYGRLLLDLETGEGDDEHFVRICRETGLWPDLARHLLAMGRVDETADIARKQDDSVLIYVADLLVQEEHGCLAQSLVRERSQTSSGWRLESWLKDYATASGDLTAALDIAESQFWQHPSLGGYQELCDLGRQLGQWEALRGRILARLGDEGHHALLTEIHLQDGELDRALEALGPVLASYWGGGELALRVAEAAAESRPRAALTLYRQSAERAIQGRSRPSYATAAHQLTRVRALYQQLGEPEAWQAYIEDLRQEHRRLRAFQDELNKAGIH